VAEITGISIWKLRIYIFTPSGFSLVDFVILLAYKFIAGIISTLNLFFGLNQIHRLRYYTISELSPASPLHFFHLRKANKYRFKVQPPFLHGVPVQYQIFIQL